MKSMKTIAEKVQEFRQSKGWNKSALAKAVGTSRQNIDNLEAGENLTPRYISKLAQVMGVTVDSLLDGNDPMPNAPLATFAERLRDSRTKAGLTAAQVGDSLGMLGQQVTNMEVRGDEIRASTLFALADLLEVDPRWLATGVENEVSDKRISQKTLTIARAIALFPDDRRDALAKLLGIKLD